jgi:hypothetical protein
LDRICKPIGKLTDVENILVRKAEGKRPLGRTRCPEEDNIKMDKRIGM